MPGNLLILLCDTPFQHESVDHVIEIADAALEKGHKVNIYLMMDGVYTPVKSQNGGPFNVTSVSDRLRGLMERGSKISNCRVCMEIRGVTTDSLPEDVDVGGIFDLSQMIEEADVVLSMVS
ncbi:MAG: DsrE family protein [Candidatus Bathyarchaeota archaeon]|jgi:tRNA 2-thiouridine synthesizing protein D